MDKDEVTSDVLKQYLDSEYPLLDKFKSTAPGTFRHCQNVMNLCEAVASDLGMDVTTMKVVAMYHDIGKMLAPQYFTENQTETNPHDSMEPHISYQIITKHVSDSVYVLVTETDMPCEIIKMVAEHHGDTILKAIFAKSESKNEDNFRYKCSKPSSEYSSVLMIVDHLEATARSISDKLTTPEAKIKVVKDTINRLRDDQQLDEMKVGTLRQVEQRLVRELDGIYHTRVDYDEKSESSDEEEAV